MTRLRALLHTTPVKVALFAIVLGIAITTGVAVSGALDSRTTPTDASLGGPVTQASLSIAVGGLCEMRSDLQQQQLTAARNVFYDKSHLFLHQLAAAVESKDRTLASNLLLAKYRVEDLISSFGTTPAAGPTAETVAPAELLNQLLGQVRTSSATLGLAAPNCQE